MNSEKCMYTLFSFGYFTNYSFCSYSKIYYNSKIILRRIIIITKEYASKILSEYTGDMFDDDILVNYVLENIEDQEFIQKLEKKAPNVYMLLYNIWSRSKKEKNN